jgi:integrase
MAKRLTEIGIANAKARVDGHGKLKRTEVADSRKPGLYLVIQPSGRKSWAVRYRRVADNKSRKLTLKGFPSLATARRLAQAALDQAAEGRDPAAEKQAGKRAAERGDHDRIELVIADFIERYAKKNTRESTWRETERILKREIEKRWKGRRVQEITRRDIIRALDDIAERGVPVMANRTLAAVRRLFNWCREKDLVQISPCEGVKAPSVERPRDRVLTDDEIRLIWITCDKLEKGDLSTKSTKLKDGWQFWPLIKLLILTGQRRSEVAEMRWSEIDLSRRTWVLPRQRVKNDTLHEVPLSDGAVAVLAKLPRIKSDPGLVFTTTGRTPVSGFTRAKNRLDSMMLNVVAENEAKALA